MRLVRHFLSFWIFLSNGKAVLYRKKVIYVALINLCVPLKIDILKNFFWKKVFYAYVKPKSILDHLHVIIKVRGNCRNNPIISKVDICEFLLFDREQRSKVLKEALVLLFFLSARFEKEQNVFANRKFSGTKSNREQKVLGNKNCSEIKKCLWTKIVQENALTRCLVWHWVQYITNVSTLCNYKSYYLITPVTFWSKGLGNWKVTFKVFFA